MNEFLLKGMDSDVSLMRKNAWTYQWGMIINTTALLNVITGHFSAPKHESLFGALFAGFSPAVCVMILLNVSLGLTVSMILK